MASAEDIRRMLDEALSPLRDQISVLQVKVNENTAREQESEEARRRRIIHSETTRLNAEAKLAMADRLRRENIELTDDEMNNLIGSKQTSSGTLKMRPEDLPVFDGSNVYQFMIASEAACSIFGPDMVAKNMARVLKGQAYQWWLTIEENCRIEFLSNYFSFKDALEKEFRDVDGVLKAKARDRRWLVGRESVSTYFYDKMQLLISAFEGALTEKDLCFEVREGTPIDFRPFIRTTLAARPNCTNLRKEMQQMETSYIESTKRHVMTPPRSPLTSPRSIQMNLSPSNNPSATAFRRSRSEPPLRETYDPKRIGKAPGPDGTMLRSYTTPAGQTILLNRKCDINKCGEDHFRFEHDHIKDGGRNKRAKSVVATVEGYPMLETDDDDSDPADPLVEEPMTPEDEPVEGYPMAQILPKHFARSFPSKSLNF